MTDFIKNIYQAVKDIIFTVKCPYCGKPMSRHDYACNDCKKNFPKNAYHVFAVGGYSCASPFPYKDSYAKAVKDFKFRNCASHAKQLSVMLVMSILEIFPDEKFDLITCVPMHKNGLKERGYNQAELLARECAEITGIPYIDTLDKHKENKKQHSIKAHERANNVKGVYKIRDKKLVKDKNILIIDDIITTGNTLGECARMLIINGCKNVSCATMCTVTAYEFFDFME